MHDMIRRARALKLARLLVFGVSGGQTATDAKVDENIKTLQTVWQTLTKENDEIIATMPGKGNADAPFEIDGDRYAKFQANLAKLEEVKTQIEALKQAKGLADWGNATPDGSVGTMTAALLASMSGQHRKSPGQLFVESEEFKALGAGKHGYTMSRAVELNGYDIGDWTRWGRKDIYTDLPSPTFPVAGGFGQIERDPIVPLPHRKYRIRDLFPARPTGAAVIQYFRQTGYATAASVVPQRDSGVFGSKPKSGIAFDGRAAVVRTVAHWVPAHRDTLADEPTLAGLIDSELTYGLQVEEDAQLLNGTGTGQDLDGIFVDPDVQDYNWSSGQTSPVPDTQIDAIRRGATKVMLSLFEPTGVVVSVQDWEAIETTKDTLGQYLLAVNIAVGGTQQVFRLPVVDTPAMAQGKALLGAFGLGAQLYDRMTPSIRIAEQHEDFFVRNAVAVLAEERIALALKRPEAFCRVHFDHHP